MASTVAVLVYVGAFAIPLFLLYRFHSAHWLLHALALLAALGMGFVQTPPEWKSPTYDLVFGGAFVFLVTWGLGGLMTFRRHHERHA